MDEKQIVLFLLHDLSKAKIVWDLSEKVMGLVQNIEDNLNEFLKEAPEAEGKMTNDYEVIEHLYGAVFVAMKNYIDYVVDKVRKLEGGKKHEIMSFGMQDKIDGYPSVLCINAVANYYKHRVEWSDNWNERRNENKTIAILMDIGINNNEVSFRNILPCLKAVDFKCVVEKLYTWHRQLVDKFKESEYITEEMKVKKFISDFLNWGLSDF